MPRQAHKLITLALPLLLAAVWMSPLVCATMPSCPMMASSDHCAPVQLPGAGGCGSSRLTRNDCCGVSSAPASDLALKASPPGPAISQPVAAADPALATTISALHQCALRSPYRPPPGGRDLLSRLQTLLI